MNTFPILYKIDSKGKIRTWGMEVENGQHRVVSGLFYGKKTYSGWTICTPKNVGKANESTAIEQAVFEVIALYKKKKDRGWSTDMPLAGDVKAFEPMLAEGYKDFKGRFPCYSQPKLYGYRCVANKDGMWTRKGKPYKLPHIWKSIKHLFEQYPDLILDGELYNHSLRDDFNQLGSLIKKPTELTAKIIEYHVYDIIMDWEDGYADRYANTFLISGLPMVVRVETNHHADQDHLDNTYAKYLSEGYEGQMIRFDTPYEIKRTKNLIKRKEFLTEEYEIVEVVEGLGNWAGYAKSITLRKGDKKFFSGIRGAMPYLHQVLLDKDYYVGKLATVRFPNFTPDGVPRFPVIIEMDVTDK